MPFRGAAKITVHSGNAKVYIDDDGIIFDAALNQTNIGGNNNKVCSFVRKNHTSPNKQQFYRLQVLHDEDEDQYWTHTRWGRVGEYGQVKTMGPNDLEGALKEYNKKFKDKSGHKWDERSEPAKKGKYTFLERSYEDDDDDHATNEKVKNEDEADDQPEAESKLPRQTQRLIELIFNQNHFNAVLEQIGYNANKLPLGKLSKSTLKQGFEHLHELASLIKHPALAGNKYQTSQKEVSILPIPSITSFRKVSALQLTAPDDRPSRTSPINITPLFRMNLAAIGLQPSSITRFYALKFPCWIL